MILAELSLLKRSSCAGLVVERAIARFFSNARADATQYRFHSSSFISRSCRYGQFSADNFSLARKTP
jgi:hypothetical protein